MFKFAHIADIHLGAFREPVLREIELKVLEETVQKCIESSLDFVLISGDIFHVSIPDLVVVNNAVRILRRLPAQGIPIYVIYGSHDHTPNGTSIIDILDTAGIFTNICKLKMVDGKLSLDFVTDEKTGAKLTGLYARKLGLESSSFEILDREKLEAETGFKIFAFHSGITELKPAFLHEMETIPLSNFPKNFDYYAGGHIHQRDEYTMPSYRKIVFPGPLFTGYGKDIEDTASGTKRGFYIVGFGEKLNEVKFVQVKGFEGAFLEYDASGVNSHDAARQINEKASRLSVQNKVVILRLKGELAGGKTTDIDFVGIRAMLSEKGALHIYINRYGLASKETASKRVAGDEPPLIEVNLFKENIGSVKVSQKDLIGDKGSELAVSLLKVLREKQKSGEQKGDYSQRIFEDALGALDLKMEFDAEA